MTCDPLEVYKKQQKILKSLDKCGMDIVLYFVVFNSCADNVEGMWRAEIKRGGAAYGGAPSEHQFGKTPHEAVNKLLSSFKHFPELKDVNFNYFNFADRAKELLDLSISPKPPQYDAV